MMEPQDQKLNYHTQVWSSIVVCIGYLSLGGCLGYPTVALPQMRNETDINVNLDEYEGSLFAATFWISGIIFSPLGGVIAGWLGRRKTLLLCTPLIAIGWVIIATASNHAMIFVGRAVTSAAVAAHMSSVNVYISETVHPNIRSNLVVLPALFMGFGNLTVWTFGFFFDWRTTAFLNMIAPILLIFLLLPLPETPYWLMEDHQEEPAKKSLAFFRGCHYDIAEEFNEIKSKHQSKMDQLTSEKSWKYALNRIFSVAFFKPFSCVGILYVVGTWTGFNSIMVYMLTFLEGSNFDPNLGPIVVGIIRIAFAGCATFFVNKVAPKKLFATCQFLTATSMGLFAIYSYVRTHYPDWPLLETFAWIPLGVVITNIIMRASGILPILHTLQAEVYPTDIRTQAIGITQASFLASGAIGVKFFPEMKNALGLHGLCVLYASVGFINTFWGMLTIPDNRGKTLVKVEEMYENKSKLEKV